MSFMTYYKVELYAMQDCFKLKIMEIPLNSLVSFGIV